MRTSNYICIMSALILCGGLLAGAPETSTLMSDKVEKTNAQWQEELTPEQYCILIEKGTERPFDNKYWDNKSLGTYYCAACQAPLFSSKTQYSSGSGWPSFWEPASDDAVTEAPDHSLGVERTEILCSRCGGHLGHVFKDGPEPTGLRYCINSGALEFTEALSGDDS